MTQIQRAQYRPGDRVVDPVTMSFATVIETTPTGHDNQMLGLRFDAVPATIFDVSATLVAPAPRLAEPGAPRLIFSANPVSPMPPWSPLLGRSGAGHRTGVPTRPDDGPRPAA